MSKNKFLLKWENGTTKFSFGGADQFPFRPIERKLLGESLSYEQIWKTTDFVENHDLRRKYKWKHMLNFYFKTQQPKYASKSIEKALWTHDGNIISSHFFVAALVGEYHFDATSYYDKQLRDMYFSFEGGKYDQVDWRDILATYKVVYHFRHIKENPLELLLLLFDIYTTGEKSIEAVKKEHYVLENASEYIKRIFLIPCITTAEIGLCESKLVDLFHVLKLEKQRITRGQFQRLLESPEHSHLVKMFAKYSWERLPTELHLTAFDEAQMRHHDNAEALLMRHKLNQAIMMYNKTIMRMVYKEWKLEMLRESGVRTFIHKVLYR